MRIIVFYIFLLLILASADLPGQEYYEGGALLSADKHNISPALAGFDGNSVLLTDYKNYRFGTPGAPQSVGLTYSGPAFKNVYWALQMQQYKIGNFVKSKPVVSFANQVQLSDNSKLLFGLHAGYSGMHYQVHNARTELLGDPLLFQQDALKTRRLFLGAGVAWQYKKFTVGAFSNHLTGIYFNNSFRYHDRIDVGFHADYRHDISYRQQIDFAGVIQAVPAEGFSRLNYALELNWNIDKKLFAGISVADALQIGINSGFALSNNLLLFYSYSAGFGAYESLMGGTHHLKLNILIKRKKIPDVGHLFPVSEADSESIKAYKLQKEYKDEIEKLKQHFNKTIYQYDERIKELEKRLENEGL